MKFTFRGIAAVLVCSVFAYTACKKLDGVKSPTSTIPQEQRVAALVAADMTTSFAGANGGVNLNEGIKLPSELTFAIPGGQHQLDQVNSLCGFTVDTTINELTKVKGSYARVKGKFIFEFTCSDTSSYPDGYIVTTDLTSTGNNDTTKYDFSLDQHYVVQSLDRQDTLVSLNGTMTSYVKYLLKPAPGLDTNATKQQFAKQVYKFKNLVIDVPQNLDITQGTATFTSIGYNAYGSWDFTGSIQYLGDHMAIITINGKQYRANLITDVITPI